MATRKQRRQRIAAAWIVGLLTLSSLALAVSGNHDEDNVFRWAGAVLAIAGACGGLTHLVRGHAKGSPLVFAPARWFLITMIELTSLIAVAFVLARRDGTNQFLSAAITPCSHRGKLRGHLSFRGCCGARTRRPDTESGRKRPGFIGVTSGRTTCSAGGPFRVPPTARAAQPSDA